MFRDPGWEIFALIVAAVAAGLGALVKIMTQKGSGNGARQYLERDMRIAQDKIRELETEMGKLRERTTRAEAQLEAFQRANGGGLGSR